MMFENSEIAIDSLPAADAVQWQELDSRYKRLLQVQALLTMLVVAVPLLFATIVNDLSLQRILIVWPAWLAVLALLLAWPYVSFPKRGYVVRDKDILYRKGVVWRSVTAIPFNRIQHVETGNTPLDRKFGLATLQLFTAGGSGGDLKIDGLAAGIAEQLRVLVLRKAGSSIEHAE